MKFNVAPAYPPCKWCGQNILCNCTQVINGVRQLLPPFMKSVNLLEGLAFASAQDARLFGKFYSDSSREIIRLDFIRKFAPTWPK